MQVDAGHGAILNNLRQQLRDQGSWQSQVSCFEISNLKREKTSSPSFSCLFGQTLNYLFQGLDERQPSIAE